MDAALDAVAQWAGGRIAIGSEPITRLFVHIGVWAFVRSALWHGPGLVGATVVTTLAMLTLATAVAIFSLRRGGDLRISRHRRSPPGPSGRQ